MTLPTKNDVQAVSPVLTNMLLAYKNADSRFVAGKVFPSIPVEKDSGTYYILTKKYWFLDLLERRAPGDEFGRVGYGVETATYAAATWGIEHKIADEIRANNQVPMALEQVGLQFLSNMSLIRKERAFAADFMAASVWTTQDNDATTDWDDYSAGDPLADLRTGKRGISQLTGMTPNTLVVGEIVDDALVIHPDIIDRIKYTRAATTGAMEGALAEVLGTNYLVATAIYNSADEGQSGTYAAIIDDDALLLHVAPGADMMTASAGKTFVWSGGGGDGQIVSYRDQSHKSDILQLSEAWDQKVTAADLGAIWLGVV